MKTISGPTFITDTDIYSSNTVRKHDLGQLAMSSDGRKFRYCKAGELLVTGDTYQSAVEDTQFQTMATAVNAAIGATEISVTNGTTAVTANMFDQGYFMVSYGTGIGQSSRILSHTTGASGATIVYTIEDPLKVAITAASSKVTVMPNPYLSVIKFAVTQTGQCVGVAQFAIPSASYGWIQTGGPAAVLFDASVTAADSTGVAPSTTTAGAACVSRAASSFIGNSLQVIQVSAYVGPVFLTID